jgi:hypothetical protein
MFNNFVQKIMPFTKYVKKYAVARRATDDITRRMRFACWIINAKNTTPNIYYLFLFHCNNDLKNTPQCYVKSTFPLSY